MRETGKRSRLLGLLAILALLFAALWGLSLPERVHAAETPGAQTPAESEFSAWTGVAGTTKFLRGSSFGGFLNSTKLPASAGVYSKDYYINNYQFGYTVSESEANGSNLAVYDHDGGVCFAKGNENVAVEAGAVKVESGKLVVNRMPDALVTESNGNQVWGFGWHKIAGEYFDPIYTTANRGPYLAATQQYIQLMRDAYYNFKGADGGEIYNAGAYNAGDPKGIFGLFGLRFSYGDFATSQFAEIYPFTPSVFGLHENNNAFVAIVENDVVSRTTAAPVETASGVSLFLMRGDFYETYVDFMHRGVDLGCPVSNDNEVFEINGAQVTGQRFTRGWIYREGDSVKTVFVQTENPDTELFVKAVSGKWDVTVVPAAGYDIETLTRDGRPVSDANPAGHTFTEVEHKTDGTPSVLVDAELSPRNDTTYYVQRYFDLTGSGVYSPDARETYAGTTGTLVDAAAAADKVGGTIAETLRDNYYVLKWDEYARGTLQSGRIAGGNQPLTLSLYYRLARYVLFRDDTGAVVHAEKVFNEDTATGLSVSDFPEIPAKPNYDGVWDRTTDLSNADFKSDSSTVVKTVYSVRKNDVQVIGGRITKVGSEVKDVTSLSDIPIGTVVVVTADTAAGKSVKSWKITGASGTDNGDGTYTFTVGTENVALRVNFQYAVTFRSEGAEDVVVQVGEGETLAVSAFPKVPERAGYTGVWDRTESLAGVTAPAAVTAVYSAKKFNVTVTGATGGGEKTFGSTVTLTAESGKTVKNWKITGAEGRDNGDGTFTFTMPAGDVTVTVEYEEKAGCGTLGLAGGLPLGLGLALCLALCKRRSAN